MASSPAERRTDDVETARTLFFGLATSSARNIVLSVLLSVLEICHLALAELYPCRQDVC